MMDESSTTDRSSHPLPAAASPELEREATVAFCQQCGRGLTASTQRIQDGGIFCAACATVHRASFPLGTTHASTSSAATPPPSSGYASVHTGTGGLGPLPPAVGAPNPVLAGLLGLIPGVGAMYNGQYPKGIIHLVIFVVLTSLADNLNWVIWWFVWGWIFYQAFEAYHTAQARRDGLILPDPFGWNDLGERLGFGRAGSVAIPKAAPGGRAAEGYPMPSAQAQPQSGSEAHAASTTATAWSSSTPNAGDASVGTPISAAAPYVAPAAAASTAWTGVPPPPAYTPTYTSASPSTHAAVSAGMTGESSRFPAGAAWLIGLGVLFLLANLAPGWRIEGRWLVPALLAALALWTAGRRILAAWNRQKSGLPATGSLAEGLIGPVLLLTVAILLALHTAGVVSLQHSWPTLLILWGVLLLLGRFRRSSVGPAGGSSVAPVASPPPDGSVLPR